MLLQESSKARARMLCAVAAVLAIVVAAAARFGLNEGSWLLLVPVVASIGAVVMPTRAGVAIALIATAAVVAMDFDENGLLFIATLVTQMLALNNLQEAATRIRRFRRPAPQ
jgi:hypothetical protein